MSVPRSASNHRTPLQELRQEHERITRQLVRFTRWSLVLIGTMPWWIPLGLRYAPLKPVWHVLDYLFVIVCHRRPERTLEIAGVLMPVCSRCAGIFAGLALGALIAWPRLRRRTLRWALLSTGLLLLFDVLVQELSWHPPWHSSRLITGGLLGYVLASGLMSALRRHRHACRP